MLLVSALLGLQGMSLYRPQSEDCSEAMDMLVFEKIRGMTPTERLRAASAACEAAERLLLAGLRAQYKDASEEEIRRRAGARRLGRELTIRMYGSQAEAWLD